MQYKENKVTDIQIAYIGGGSRGWAWTLMKDLAVDAEISGTVRLYDIDEAAAKSNEVIGNALSKREDVIGQWNYTTCQSLQEVLTGCDFVVLSILPGTFDEMASDVHLPERLGIYQSVGDTAGPGGMIRALRTIPMLAQIAEGVKNYAQDAWVINYTNPMSLCVKTLYQVFPQIKAFGCCHEVFGTQKVLAGICNEVLEIKDIDRRDIHVNVLGINHFTWFDQASYKGIDLFPIYKKYCEEHYEEGFEEKDMNWANNTFHGAHRVKFDLFLRYGMIAAAGDRHLAEFMPGEEYLKDPETVTSWKFGLTSVDWRKEDLQKRLEKSRKYVEGDPLVLDKSGEEGVLLIKALCGLTRVISNVNIPNISRQIANLPAEAIVETNAVFSRDSIKPVMAGSIPENALSLFLPHVKNQERILKAAFTYDESLVVDAFLEDPLVKGRAKAEEIKALVQDMIKNTKKYLPDGWSIE